MVVLDRWLPADQSYSIYIFSYPDGVKSGLVFIADITRTETIQVAGVEVRKLVGENVINHTDALIHIGPINHAGKNHVLTYSSGAHATDPRNLELFYQMLATFQMAN